jgi:hypothetical protein
MKIKYFKIVSSLLIILLTLSFTKVNAATLMNIDYPKVNEEKTDTLRVLGWVMSTSNNSIKAYIDTTEIELTRGNRPDVINAIKEARALGDLSENAEYHAARDRQGQVEARIKELEYLIDNATIIEDNAKSNTVQVGSTVEIKYIADNETETCSGNCRVISERRSIPLSSILREK